MAKDRKAGYYWIQKDDKWMIAEWIYGFWYIPGSELEYSDTEIYEVGDYIGRGGDKVYSESANCAIFDVSKALIAFFKWREGKQLTADTVNEIETFAKEYESNL